MNRGVMVKQRHYAKSAGKGSLRWWRRLVFCLVAVLVAGCATAPYTGRSQFIMVSRQQELSLGAQASAQTLKQERISRDPHYNELVKRVGERIAQVANQPDFAWEFHVIDKPNVPNAFCLPGGKIFVYTGIFKFAQTEAELAAVVGHEVAHALNRHGAERMSMQMAAQMGGTIAGAALGLGGIGGQAFDAAYGLGTDVGVMLPFSRTHEYEADEVGLILMAKAGYDPQAALVFWQRMADADKGKQRMEFLSTHPADEHRIEALRSLLPQAEAYYRGSP